MPIKPKMSHLQTLLTTAAHPLPPIHHPTFASHFDSLLSSSRITLLGDGSHGTSQFYSARAEITKRLITHHGVTTIAIEADWPDAETIDRYIRQRPAPKPSSSSSASQPPFQRFPTWMWRNRETFDLIEWLRTYNASRPAAQQVGFYGLDLYSLGTSIRAVTDYLDRIDPAAGKEARRRYGCLQPWVEDPTAYGLASLRGMADCEKGVVDMLRDLLQRRLEYTELDPHDGEEYHSSQQNAYLVRDAERYYKAMYYSSAESWTLRDTHMVDTLRRVLRRKGPAGKAVVWAHNSHCGDARYTGMGRGGREVNIGQLCREQFGDGDGDGEVVLVGCGTHAGTVAAAREWDEKMEVMKVRPSREDSWEWLAHRTGVESFVWDLRGMKGNGELRELMERENRLERFIGVIYRPETERMSHYSEVDLLDQFDAYVWFDRTDAVQPLETGQPKTAMGTEETYPFGL
ncbi:putative erythromycin esterase [Aspergillus ibericus CBS 121593]|uniref:Erythromycin esterase n=1 Tax=Aspergillus ibericus CBS 121593 TaxID=1448316 RepID=A0A395H1L9_9EURO|nr:hypothetical protein BO80DRAFT_407947 [Aspergillus ibericus CBS 121593]RAL00738.1 hypothetical protein BO80DRAFT_407947 [Aspergillus ibericus CBS 121593]